MVKFLALAITAALLVACAPPRWMEARCRDQPSTWELPNQELTIILDPMTDKQLLDLAACNMATSHPSNFGFPANFVTDRSSTMPELLLARLEAGDEGLISMGYVDLLDAIARAHPQALTPIQRSTAKAQCLRHYQMANSVCDVFD